MMEWLSKLTPWDSELLLMVESLTGVCPDIKNGGTHYFFEVDYSKHHDSEFINAVMDAIAGRLGNRLIKITDEPDAERLIVRAKFHAGELPKIVHYDANGTVVDECDYLHWIPKNRDVFAVQVTKDNIDRLVHFVGGGDLVTYPDGSIMFRFLNASKGVWQEANDGTFVVRIRDGHFVVVDKSEVRQLYRRQG